MAKPLTGTTLTHFAALRHVLGEAEFARFLDGLFANEVVFLQCNGATMREVAAGRAEVGRDDLPWVVMRYL